MKKSIQININSRIYNIDDDAYARLNNYLKELRLAFGDADGDEIVNDIEARISEIFAQRENSIIVLADVNEVIERMGRPEQLSDGFSHATTAGATADDETADTVPPPYYSAQTPPPVPSTGRRKLYRSFTNRVFGGVLGGIATYFNWNATVLRILVTVFALCTALWPCVIIYLVAWMILPEARTARQRLEQQGTVVTVSQVGNQVLDDEATTQEDAKINVMSVIGKCVVGFLGIVAVIVAIGTFIGLVACSTQSIALACLPLPNPMTSTFVIGALSCLAVLIPSVMVIWFASHVLFKARGAAPWLTITAVIAEVIIIVAITILATLYNFDPSANICIF